MRRVLLSLAVLGGLVVAAIPLGVPTLAARHGVSVGHAGWCGEGLCLTDLARGPVQVARAVVRWDRSVDLEGARAAAGELGGADGDDAAGEGAVPPLVAEVRVHDLRVEGTPLPPLEGTVWPARRLRGEGVEVDGDVVRARVPTDWGEVEAEVRPDGDALAVEATCADCAWSDPALGPAPLRAAVRARLRVEDRRRFRGTVRVGEVTVEVEGERVGTGATGRFRLPATPLSDVYALLGPVVPEVRRARVDGTLEGEGAFDLPDGRLDFTPRVSGFTVDGVLPPGYDLGPFQRMTRDATGNTGIGTFGEGSADWVGRGGLGEWLPRAVIAAEDGRFRSHPGYDLEGMLAAAADNRERGEVWRGGSTLTQQLAKNLFLDGSRTYARKARELLYAVEMERELGKQRILELYLNVVEWGPGIYGARRAADVYFLKSPAGLLPEEAAWLASILPSPRSAWADQYLKDRPNLARVGQILDNMPDLDPDARAAAKARRVRFVPPGR